MSRFHDYMSRRQPAPSLADIAIGLDLPVFPCDDHKRPLTLRGFKDASRDPAVIRRMFSNPRAVMIGVPTGAISGFVVVDVDVKNGGQGQAWLDANSHRLVQTRTIRTGSGGLHLYFLHPSQPVKNSASKLAPNIDVRGDGGYVIVPPSPGYAVADDAPIAEIPAWLLPAILPPPEPAQPTPAVAYQPRQHAATGYRHAALESACWEIANAPDGAKHETLNREAYSIGGLVLAGELGQAEALAALRDALEAIRSRCADFKAAERTLHKAFRDGMAKPRDVPEADFPPPVEGPHPAAAFLAKIQAKAASAAKPVPVPTDIMDVPGALRMFIDHCNATAISPQPFLALAAGICMVGALAGRKYRTSTDLRTNIYAIGVADSGAGKDHARKQIVRCLYDAGLPQYLGGTDLASASGLRTAMNIHPAKLFQIDEFGDWLTGVLGDKAPTHRKQIAAMLKELYSSAAGPWQGIEYADQSKAGRPREDIHQPNACLYGTTTPGQFWNALEGASMHDGLMARMLLFVSPCSYPDEQEPVIGEPQAELLTALQAIAAGPSAGADGNLDAVMSAAVSPKPFIVPETPEAAAARRRLRQDQLAQQRKAEGTYVTAIAGRLAENAMKLALVRAISRSPAAPVIQAADVEWGRALSQHCVDVLLRDASRHVADTDYQRNVNKTLDYIRRHGPVSEGELIRKGLGIEERKRMEILRAIVSAGLARAIECPPGPKGGRATIRYEVVDDTSRTPDPEPENAP